jgi:Asp/Glu/hydantoin racemase
MGLAERLAGERPLGLTVAETASDERAFARMETVGRELVEKDRADVIVMACAGMARHRRRLETTLQVPVIDPTQAAVAMAIGAVQAQML